MAARTRHRGHADAGVAGSRLDNPASVGKLAPLFKISQQLPCRAIFHRAKRIHPFELRVKWKFCAPVQFVEPDERGWIFLAGQHLENILVNPRLVIHMWFKSSLSIDNCSFVLLLSCWIGIGNPS